jgi:hypothetical protein
VREIEMQYCILQRDFNTATGETLNRMMILLFAKTDESTREERVVSDAMTDEITRDSKATDFYVTNVTVIFA